MGPRVAASVAARGVMFANAHPAPRRWQPLRGPASSAVERSAAASRVRCRCAHAGCPHALRLLTHSCVSCDATAQAEVAAAVAGACGGDASCGGSAANAASEVLPYLRLLASRAPPGAALHFLPPRRSAAPGAHAPPPRRADAATQPRDVDRGAAAAAPHAPAAVGSDGELDDPVDDDD